VPLHEGLDGVADIAEVAPGRIAAMPRIIDSYVTSISSRALVEAWPATYIRLLSPCQPSRITVTSMFTMSPSASTRSPGMPWQTTWLIEVQDDLV
jgi:hypothetical protein